jgi:hypothetical protein
MRPTKIGWADPVTSSNPGATSPIHSRPQRPPCVSLISAVGVLADGRFVTVSASENEDVSRGRGFITLMDRFRTGKII